MTVIVAGMFGLIGLVRVVSIVLSGRRDTEHRVLTIVLVSVGIGGLVLFNAVPGGIDPRDAPAAALVYWILPALGTIHLLYLARHSLFAGSGSP